MLSGFIANTGKLIPIKLPVVRNFLTTKPNILPALPFHYSFNRVRCPFYLTYFQLLGSTKNGSLKYSFLALIIFSSLLKDKSAI
jgi:hypothetical protein